MQHSIKILVPLIFLLSTQIAWAEPATMTEPETGTTFKIRKSFGGIDHVLVGVGPREVTAFRINVYGAGLYVGVKRAIPAWQSYLKGRFAKAGLITSGQPNFSKMSTSSAAYHFMIYGRFPKTVDIEFVRNAEGHKFIEAYNDNWKRLKVDQAKAGEPLKQFMAHINHNVSKGDHMVIRTSGSSIWVTMPKVGTKHIKGNPYFVTALWRIYFANPCPQKVLRKGFLSKLDRLHALASGS